MIYPNDITQREAELLIRRGRELMSTVREWHPKCETCGHKDDDADELFEAQIVWCNKLNFDFDAIITPKTFGCLAHTDFDAED